MRFHFVFKFLLRSVDGLLIEGVDAAQLIAKD